MLVGGVLSPDDVADSDVREVIAMLPPLTGDSCIVDPTGEVDRGTRAGEEILLAKGSLELVRTRRRRCATSAATTRRPDVLRLVVDRRPARRIVERSTRATTTSPPPRVSFASG